MQKIAISLFIILEIILIRQQFYDEDVVCQELENSCYEDYDYQAQQKSSEQEVYPMPELEWFYEMDEEEKSKLWQSYELI